MLQNRVLRQWNVPVQELDHKALVLGRLEWAEVELRYYRVVKEAFAVDCLQSDLQNIFVSQCEQVWVAVVIQQSQITLKFWSQALFQVLSVQTLVEDQDPLDLVKVVPEVVPIRQQKSFSLECKSRHSLWQQLPVFQCFHQQGKRFARLVDRQVFLGQNLEQLVLVVVFWNVL